ncbi:hypothetical protein E8L90_29715 [Brevibacillus antibioticus]|uniref:Uncharacterized protein n=1 Tax=Brevibacillus antibioticus TaxID=2570228 RepID=A0A4U2XZK9_9BACL|nr:hypothetical protein [Brevibacillus antibioticus]TKI52935.1 hypothetical protein E8L90_29715 [Brevibacillus antibioticus]
MDNQLNQATPQVTHQVIPNSGQRMLQVMDKVIYTFLPEANIPMGISLTLKTLLPKWLPSDISDEQASQVIHELKGFIAYVESGEQPANHPEA